MNGCWQEVGVFGDGSCEQLAKAAHCRNCQTFTDAGRSLFDRPAPDEFIEQWTELLSRQKESIPPSLYAALVFRLSGEWYALKTDLLHEIMPMAAIQYVPHRSNKRFAGLVNVHGELVPCMNLHELLGVAMDESPEQQGRQRMIIGGQSSRDRFVLPVDEVFGVIQVVAERLSQPPSSIEKSERTFVSTVISVSDWHAGLLESGAFFDHLTQCLTGGA